jgi:hypothetical protein
MQVETVKRYALGVGAAVGPRAAASSEPLFATIGCFSTPQAPVGLR